MMCHQEKFFVFLAIIFLNCGILLAEPIKLTDISGNFSVTVQEVDVQGDSLKFKRTDGTFGLIPIIKVNKNSLVRIIDELKGRLEKKPLLITDIKVIESTILIRENPAEAATYFNRGLIFYDRSEFDNAIADYNKAIELDPKYADAYFCRGEIYSNRKFEFKKAIDDFTQVIELDRERVAAYQSRGSAFRSLGNKTRAAADFKRYKELIDKNKNH